MVTLLQKAWQGEGVARGAEVMVARVTAVEPQDLA